MHDDDKSATIWHRVQLGYSMNELLQIDRLKRPLMRRLAAIAFLDVVGYSRLMSTSEETTLKAWSDLRKTVIEPRIRTGRGRIIDRAGDGIFAEFASALDALDWAIDVQDAIPRHGHMGVLIELRIALHLADVIDGPDGEVMGDGVNIAARLQTHADAGGIIVSQAVVDAVRGKTAVVFTDLGLICLRNINYPVRSFQVRLSPEIAIAASSWGGTARIALCMAGITAFLLLVLAVFVGGHTTPRDQAQRLLRQGLAIGCTDYPCPHQWLAKRALFERAITVDPTFARPYAEATFTYTNFVANHMSIDPGEDLHAAARLATRAVALAPDKAFAHEARGAVLRQNPDQLEYALTAYLRVLAIDTNRTSARANAGWMLVLLGRPAEAEPYLRDALAAAPNDESAPFWLNRLGLAELFLDHYGNAVDYFRRAMAQQSRREAEGDRGLERAIDLASALALNGEVDAARQLIERVRRQQPSVSTHNIWNCVCSHAVGFQEGMDKLRRGAILAGVLDVR